jgi:hypothetical protein
MKILKHFDSGRSNCPVMLVESEYGMAVFKTHLPSPSSIVDKMSILPFKQPIIYEIGTDNILMEYIPGMNIIGVINEYGIDSVELISNFISSYFDFSLCNTINEKFDYTDTVKNKIKTSSSYISTDYYKGIEFFYQKNITHGDFTFDNMIYHNDEFYLIDAHPTNFDSIHFDANKLRQDLTGHWFARYEKNIVTYEEICGAIYENLKPTYGHLFDDALYNLMVSRIFPYCKYNSYDFEYIKNMVIPILDF